MKEKFAKILNWIKTKLEKLPQISDAAMPLACKICGGIIAVCSLFFIFEMFTYEGFGISANWNIFTSWLCGPLYFVGLILAIVKWGAFGHWGATPYDVYEDEYGNKKAVRNDDVVENLFAQIMMPILGHFVIEPLVYACIIYYPLMCIVALFGVVLPFALSLILVGVCVLLIVYNKFLMNVPYRSLVLVVTTLFVSVALLWSSISMESKKHVNPTVETEEVSTPAETPAQVEVVNE